MGLLDRIRGEGVAESTAAGANALVDRLGSIARRGGQLAGRVADGVKEATPRRLLREAIDAQARGNVGAAFFLAAESIEAEPGDPDADAFFWDVALAYGEPAAAAESAARLVQHHAGHDGPELAAQYFRELVAACEPALVEPSVLVRLLPDLVAGLQAALANQPEDAVAGGAPAAGEATRHGALETTTPAAHRAAVQQALAMCVHPENTQLSTGLAMRVAELARELAPEVALAAARRALAADDVHEAKRAKLAALVRELDPEAEIDDAHEALEVDEADLAAVSIEIEADESEAAELVAPDPIAEPISEAEADRIASFLEPAEEELETIAHADFTDSVEIDDLDVLPRLDPIDDDDPSRNHPSRVESPVHEELSEDEVDRMRARIERALGASGPPDASGVASD